MSSGACAHYYMHFHQGVELPGHKVRRISSVLANNTKSFSKLPVPTYIPTSNIGVPIVLHPPTIRLFYFSHSGGSEVTSLCGFDF